MAPNQKAVKDQATDFKMKLRLIEWWAWEDLNFRPHAYQARALTN